VGSQHEISDEVTPAACSYTSSDCFNQVFAVRDTQWSSDSGPSQKRRISDYGIETAMLIHFWKNEGPVKRITIKGAIWLISAQPIAALLAGSYLAVTGADVVRQPCSGD
jgi:hypothetical protein